MTIRVARLPGAEDGEWRLVHRHGGFLPAGQSVSHLG